MKVFSILSFFMCLYFQAGAQLYIGGQPLDSLNKQYVYVCPNYNQSFTSCKAEVDYGQGKYTLTQTKNLFYLTDRKGTFLKFKSGVTILNLMVENGYEVVNPTNPDKCNIYRKMD
ncbi:MAG: hypothetical protein AAFZ15_21505 [Bacteroidota bacterium]